MMRFELWLQGSSWTLILVDRDGGYRVGGPKLGTDAEWEKSWELSERDRKELVEMLGDESSFSKGIKEGA